MPDTHCYDCGTALVDGLNANRNAAWDGIQYRDICDACARLRDGLAATQVEDWYLDYTEEVEIDCYEKY